jgi:DNA-binding NtrC family response regulator
VIELRVPSLRERRDDIQVLAAHMLQRLAAGSGRAAARLHPQALEALKSTASRGMCENWKTSSNGRTRCVKTS